MAIAESNRNARHARWPPALTGSALTTSPALLQPERNRAAAHIESERSGLQVGEECKAPSP